MIFRYFFRIVTLIFFSMITVLASAQQVHFIYLQTDNAQPFYVKLNNNVTSSSSLGYLILPKLSDGNYDITVGFPKKEFPEEKFQLSIDKNNEGFLLKNFGDKGWGLFNLQSLSVVMGAGENDVVNASTIVQNDPFSKMLATVVKDSSILEKPKEVVASAPGKSDTVAMVNAGADTSSALPHIIQPVLLSTVTRTLFNKSKDGVEMIYIDKLDNDIDTIRIFIPISVSDEIDDNSSKNTGEIKKDTVAKAVLKSPETLTADQGNNIFLDKPDTSKSITNPPLQEQEQVAEDSVVLQKNTSDRDVAKLVNINSIKEEEAIGEPSEKKKNFPEVVQFSKINSDCKAFASNEDFLRLRKKIAGETNDDNMLKEAKKGFHSRCFSTEQIKNLSFLFLNDEGKYHFFDAAYAYTSDSDQYYKLQSQLSDPYYINRFKAMIHK
ncbi:MAG: DUF4476 domain-containing protein [Ginsengibacter sp.]